MGQTIEISNVDVVGNVAVFTANRTLGGQDGETFAGPVHDPTTYPGRLANRLYEMIEGINHVFILSNTVTVRHPEGWDEQRIHSVNEVITPFFRFYEEAAASV